MTILTMSTNLETTAVRWIDLAAFAAMGILWIFVLAMLYGIYRVLRSKGRGDAGWGDSPGM